MKPKIGVEEVTDPENICMLLDVFTYFNPFKEVGCATTYWNMFYDIEGLIYMTSIGTNGKIHIFREYLC